MAATPRYGGTNSVTELNVGQKGSGLNPGSTIFEAHVHHGKPENPVAVSKPIQTNETIMDVLGFQGQVVTWRGNIKFANNANMIVVMNNISRALNGTTRSFTTGAPSAVTANELNPTRLVDAYGNVMSDKARMIDARWERVRALAGSTFTLWTNMVLTFRLLR